MYIDLPGVEMLLLNEKNRIEKEDKIKTQINDYYDKMFEKQDIFSVGNENIIIISEDTLDF